MGYIRNTSCCIQRSYSIVSIYSRMAIGGSCKRDPSVGVEIFGARDFEEASFLKSGSTN